MPCQNEFKEMITDLLDLFPFATFEDYCGSNVVVFNPVESAVMQEELDTWDAFDMGGFLLWSSPKGGGNFFYLGENFIETVSFLPRLIQKAHILATGEHIEAPKVELYKRQAYGNVFRVIVNVDTSVFIHQAIIQHLEISQICEIFM